MRLLLLKPTERSGKKLLRRDLRYRHRMCNPSTIDYADLWNREISGRKSVENGAVSSSSRTSSENNRQYGNLITSFNPAHIAMIQDHLQTERAYGMIAVASFA